MTARKWEFEVDSDSEPGVVYLVRWELHDNGELYATCTCPAGERGVMCKHRTRTLPRVPVHAERTTLGRLVAEREALDAKYEQLIGKLRRERSKERERITTAMQEFTQRW